MLELLKGFFYPIVVWFIKEPITGKPKRWLTISVSISLLLWFIIDFIVFFVSRKQAVSFLFSTTFGAVIVMLGFSVLAVFMLLFFAIAAISNNYESSRTGKATERLASFAEGAFSVFGAWFAFFFIPKDIARSTINNLNDLLHIRGQRIGPLNFE